MDGNKNMSPKTPHPLEHVLSIFGTECSMPMPMIVRFENEDISWNTHIRHRLRDPPTHVLMRTEDSLPQDLLCQHKGMSFVRRNKFLCIAASASSPVSP